MATTPQYFFADKTKNKILKTVFRLMAEPVLDYSVFPLCLEYHICGMAEGWEEASVAAIC